MALDARGALMLREQHSWIAELDTRLRQTTLDQVRAAIDSLREVAQEDALPSPRQDNDHVASGS